MARPVIGITTYIEPASWGVWRDIPTALVPHAYVRHVAEAGGLPVLIPPLPTGATREDVDTVLSRVDGLLLAGGGDLDPSRYDAEPHPTVQPSRPQRDDSELDLARASGESGLPVLGICRGMQVMAVAAGGDLVQHLPDVLGSETHLPAPGVYGRHEVKIEPGTLLASVLGDRVEVAHYHHQGVGRHPGLNPTAYSHDGLLEAFEDPDAPFRLGVQWHPEQGEDPRLFEALVEAASERR